MSRYHGIENTKIRISETTIHWKTSAMKYLCLAFSSRWFHKQVWAIGLGQWLDWLHIKCQEWIRKCSGSDFFKLSFWRCITIELCLLKVTQMLIKKFMECIEIISHHGKNILYEINVHNHRYAIRVNITVQRKGDGLDDTSAFITYKLFLVCLCCVHLHWSTIM